MKSSRSASSFSFEVFTIAHIAALQKVRIRASKVQDHGTQCCHAHEQANSNLSPELHLEFPKCEDRDNRQENVSESGTSYKRQD